MDIESPSTLLQIFEDLGSLSETGLIEIKPFKRWPGFKWQEQVFTMRLCNAGETLDILSSTGKFADAAKSQAIKQEIMIRSIFSVDGRALITAEELQDYNEKNGSKLSELEYLRTWVKSIEQVILDRIDVVYSDLQMKQIRILQGMCLCEMCGNTYMKKELPNNSHYLKYSLGEIVCGNCMPQVVTGEYDFLEEHLNPKPASKSNSRTEDTVESSEETKSSNADTELDYICVCGSKFEDYEAFIEHKSDCPAVVDSLQSEDFINPVRP